LDIASSERLRGALLGRWAGVVERVVQQCLSRETLRIESARRAHLDHSDLVSRALSTGLVIDDF
jgi:hypothetical protein